MKATIFDIQRNSYVDGPGIRTTVFFKGCNLKCKWCHNPESQENKPQMLFYKDKCNNCKKCIEVCLANIGNCMMCGRCVMYCPNDAREICGKKYTADEVLDEILKDKSYFQISGGGVTFSGGECMLQIEFLLELIKICKKNNIHTAIDTAGNVPWEYFEKIIPYTDLFLYDVKCFSEKLHIEGTGVSNRQILENLKRLSIDCSKKITVRIPIIPSFNDNKEEIDEILKCLCKLKIQSIEPLPYHKMGENKYKALGMKFYEYDIPSEEIINSIKNRKFGFIK